MASSDHESEEREQSRNGVRDKNITRALRRAVRTLCKRDPDVSARKIRAHVETELDLEPQFLKTDPHWGERAKEIIAEEYQAQAEAEAEAEAEEEAEPETPEVPVNTPAKSKEKKTTQKRARKQTKKVAPDDEEDELDDKAPEPKKRKRAVRVKKQKSEPVKLVSDDIEPAPEPEPPQDTVKSEPVEQESELSDLQDSTPALTTEKSTRTIESAGTELAKLHAEGHGKRETDSKTNGDKTSGEESDMSVLLDPSPPKKKSRSRSTPLEVKKGKGRKEKKEKMATKPKKAKAVEQPALSSDEQQIKSLQGWLLKCGIRKFWSRELAKFETSKEKIEHLKQMLADVGMAPRYSAEKAKRIKEERELQAEVEAAQEFGDRWGNEGDGPAKTRSRRSAVAAQPEETKRVHSIEEFAFLQDQSEESD